MYHQYTPRPRIWQENKGAQNYEADRQDQQNRRAVGKDVPGLESQFFDNQLPEPVITLKKTPGAYDHITCAKTWTVGAERRYEVNINTATLDRPIEEVAATLLHELCHLYNMEQGIKDTSNNGVYHNQRFKQTAEAHGLIIEKSDKYGWTLTTPSLELLDFIERQGWVDIQMTEGFSWLDMLGTGTGSRTPGSREPGAEKPPKRPSSTRKYSCPCCGQSVRATKAVNILCGDCMQPMRPAE